MECKVDGCKKEVTSNPSLGWCEMHRGRWRRWGDVNIVKKVMHHNTTTTCRVEGCERLRNGRSSLCVMHGFRWSRHRDLEHKRKSQSEMWTPELRARQAEHARNRKADKHPSWKGDDVKYEAVHSRLRKYRGSATKFPCVDCGKPAQGWSFKHDAKELKWSAFDRELWSCLSGISGSS